jgi:cation diffusion facilitator CzcD-associated flavoprotein CzcO
VTEVIIIGAGPYGLSIAAHLRSLGIGYRIFGRTMYNWRAKMPAGMLLKSDPFASNLSDPAGALSLKNYCAAQNIPYDDEAIRVSLETFLAYGDAFQRRFVPDVDERLVVAVEPTGNGFAVKLEDGEVVSGQKVIVGIGISDFPYIPPVLSQIPAPFLSHAADHGELERFRGKEVAVVGAGSSGIDLAALLHEAGAEVQVVMRQKQLKFHDRTPLGNARPMMTRLRAPNTGIGPGWRNVFYTRTPQLFRYLPQDRRVRTVLGTHGPAGGWFMRDRVVGKVAVHAGLAPQSAEIRDGRVQLQLAGPDVASQTLAVDHVVACTGYKVDVDAIGFLGDKVRQRIALVGRAPELSAHFETSVPGLYVVGPAAAFSFGPNFRFVVGCEFTAPRIAGHLARTMPRRSMVQGAAVAARQEVG